MCVYNGIMNRKKGVLLMYKVLLKYSECTVYNNIMSRKKGVLLMYKVFLKYSECTVYNNIMYRKKGVLLMYKVFLKYPEALRPAFPRLKEKLEDTDPGVQVTFVLYFTFFLKLKSHVVLNNLASIHHQL